jgi:hypothetical protein
MKMIMTIYSKEAFKMKMFIQMVKVQIHNLIIINQKLLSKSNYLIKKMMKKKLVIKNYYKYKIMQIILEL